VQSTAFQVTPGAHHLFISQLSNQKAGVNFGTVTVQVLKLNGQLEQDPTDSPQQVELFIENNPGGAKFLLPDRIIPRSQPLIATVTDGIATFGGKDLEVILDKAGVGFPLGARPVGNDLVLSGTSNRFVIAATDASGLEFVEQPTYAGTSDMINFYN